MTESPSVIVLCLVQNSLQAWEATPETRPNLIQLQGQEQVTIRGIDNLCGAWHDLIERLHDNGRIPTNVYWLLDNEGQTLWLNAVRQDSALTQFKWQVLAWEWLIERLNLTTDATLQLEAKVLPWLISTEQRALSLAQEDEAARLANERQQLQQDNERLRVQNIALQHVDIERLLTFLPALYSRIFTHLGAIDLAALSGKVEPLNIPNPYPEPTDETLNVLQKRFRSLPREKQLEIVQFIKHVPQRQKLSLRPEMRALVIELEDEC